MGKRLLKRDFSALLGEYCRYSYFRRSCGAGKDTIFLNADGGVYPCPNLADARLFSFGSIRETACEGILTGRARKEFLNNHTIDNYKACGDCTIRFWCAGACRGETFANTGDMSATGYNYAYYKEAFLRAMWAESEGT